MPVIYKQGPNYAGMGELATALLMYPTMRDRYKLDAENSKIGRDLNLARTKELALKNTATQNLHNALAGQEDPMAWGSKGYADYNSGLSHKNDMTMRQTAMSDFDAGNPERAYFGAGVSGRNVTHPYGIQGGMNINKVTGTATTTPVGKAQIAANTALAGSRNAKTAPQFKSPSSTELNNFMPLLQDALVNNDYPGREAYESYGFQDEDVMLGRLATEGAGNMKALTARGVPYNEALSQTMNQLLGAIQPPADPGFWSDDFVTYDPQPQAVPQQPGAVMPQVNTPQEAAALPSGTQFIGPDGLIHIKP